MKAALYLRVSTTDGDQNVAVQEEPLREWVEGLGYEPVVYAEEGVSGARTSRPVLDRLMRDVRQRKVRAVAVWKLDRLGRSLQHLLQVLGEFESRGIRFLEYGEGLDTNTASGRLFLQIRGAFAEYERAIIVERVNAGMAYAKVHGTKSGNPIGRARVELSTQDVLNTLNTCRGELYTTLTAQANSIGIDRQTLRRRMREIGYAWAQDHWQLDPEEEKGTRPDVQTPPAAGGPSGVSAEALQ